MAVTFSFSLAPWGTHGCPRSVTVAVRERGLEDVAALVSVSAEPCDVCGEVPGALWTKYAVEAVQTAIDKGRLAEFVAKSC